MVAYVYSRPLNLFQRSELNRRLDTTESIDFSVLTAKYRVSPIAMACFILKHVPQQIKVLVTDNTALAAYLATYAPFRFYVRLIRFTGTCTTVELTIPKFDQNKYLEGYPAVDIFAANGIRENAFRLDIERFVREFRQLDEVNRRFDKDLNDILDRMGKSRLL